MGGCVCTEANPSKDKNLEEQEKKESISLIQKQKGARKYDKKNNKVVIVGAGPAGIHMCSLLVKSGWNVSNITILEKTDRPCGKSYSVDDPDIFDSYKPVHELG
eukprot:247734_1